MNINHLRYFEEVCKNASITKAADVVHVSQPSITAAIKELEKEFGILLFHRINNRLSLTEEGKEFLNSARRLLTELDCFYKETLELNSSEAVTLKLGIPAILGTFFLHRIVPGFHDKHPNINLKVYEVPTLTGAEMISEATLDLLIGIMDNHTYAHCDSHFLFSTDLVFAVSGKNPLSKEKVITKHSVKKEPFVIVSKGSYHFNSIMNYFSDMPLNIIMNTSQTTTLKYMVENNYATTIVYREIFERNPLVRCIPLDPPIQANVCLFWRKHTYLSRSMKALAAYLRGLDLI